MGSASPCSPTPRYKSDIILSKGQHVRFIKLVLSDGGERIVLPQKSAELLPASMNLHVHGNRKNVFYLISNHICNTCWSDLRGYMA